MLVLAFARVTAAVTQTMVVPLIAELPVLLDTTASSAAFVVSATLLAAAVATPVSGRLGDLYGKRRIMLLCALVLTAGSALCAVAESIVPMVVGRGMQGVGTGLIPLGISVMRDVIAGERLGSSIAVMSASMGVGAALGLPAAAVIVEHVSWLALFWLAAALGSVIFALILRLVPATPVVASGRFDPIGAVGLVVGMVALLLGVSKGADWGWLSASTLGCLALACVVLVAWAALVAALVALVIPTRSSRQAERNIEIDLAHQTAATADPAPPLARDVVAGRAPTERRPSADRAPTERRPSADRRYALR